MRNLLISSVYNEFPYLEEFIPNFSNGKLGFKREVLSYIVISGTFLLPNCKERGLPFLY